MSVELNQSVVEGRGTNVTVTHTRTDQRSGVFAPTMTGTVFETLIAALVTALALFGQNVRTAVGQFLPNVVSSHIRAAVINVLLSQAFKNLQKAGIAEAVAVAKAWATALTIDPATIATAAVRARATTLMDGTDIAGKASLLQNFNEQQLAGVMEVGMLDDLPQEIATAGRERYVVLRHVRLTGLQADYARTPSADFPLASGPDMDAAIMAAKASVAELKQRSKNIDMVSTVLNNVVSVVAIAGECHRDQAYSLLTTGKIDA
jgi:hypothetical protein